MGAAIFILHWFFVGPVEVQEALCRIWRDPEKKTNDIMIGAVPPRVPQTGKRKFLRGGEAIWEGTGDVLFTKNMGKEPGMR